MQFQNATRKREFRVDQLKYRPNMIDYESARAKKNPYKKPGKKTVASMRGSDPNIDKLDLDIDIYQSRQTSGKRINSTTEKGSRVPSQL